MPIYQLYRLDSSGTIVDHATEIECDNDDTARSISRERIGEDAYIEIWCGGRLVGRVP